MSFQNPSKFLLNELTDPQVVVMLVGMKLWSTTAFQQASTTRSLGKEMFSDVQSTVLFKQF